MDLFKCRRRNAARAESRRQQVLDAAAACFRESGFRGASMADISRRAGMSTGHIYHYFKSKEEIVEAIVERDQGWGLTMIERLKESGNILQAMIDDGRQAMIERTATAHPALLLEFLAEASRNPLVAAICGKCDEAIGRSLEELMTIGQHQGSIAADVDVRAMARLLMVLWDGLTVCNALQPNFDRESMTAIYHQVLQRLLLPKELPRGGTD
jgi:AcrR family transcriptional regulator